MEKLAKALGERIRTQRKACGISQDALALACSIDRSYMGRIERGEVNITVEAVSDRKRARLRSILPYASVVRAVAPHLIESGVQEGLTRSRPTSLSDAPATADNTWRSAAFSHYRSAFLYHPRHRVVVDFPLLVQDTRLSLSMALGIRQYC